MPSGPKARPPPLWWRGWPARRRARGARSRARARPSTRRHATRFESPLPVGEVAVEVAGVGRDGQAQEALVIAPSRPGRTGRAPAERRGPRGNATPGRTGRPGSPGPTGGRRSSSPTSPRARPGRDGRRLGRVGAGSGGPPRNGGQGADRGPVALEQPTLLPHHYRDDSADYSQKPHQPNGDHETPRPTPPPVSRPGSIAEPAAAPAAGPRLARTARGVRSAWCASAVRSGRRPPES